MSFLKGLMAVIKGLSFFLKGVLMTLIYFYQVFISPLKKPSCRYYPSCSTYSYEALNRHGIWRGSCLALKRILRCHPWVAGGIDLVPSSKDDEAENQ